MPNGKLHIIHVQAASQAQIFDAKRASLTTYYDRVVRVSQGRGSGLRASRRSKMNADDEAEELEKSGLKAGASFLQKPTKARACTAKWQL